MASRTITFRFPEDIVEAIEARARATGSNRTAVLMEALSQAYGLPLPSPVLVSTAALQQRLHDLEQQVVTLLEQLAGSIQTLNQNAAIATRGFNHFPGESEELIGNPDQWLAQLEYRTKALEQILSATLDLVFVQDRTGRFTYVNSAAARALGTEPSYLMGKMYQDLNLAKEIGKPFSAGQETVFMTGRPASGEMSIPTIHETRDYEYILSPIQNSDGSIEAVVCNARDITERKRADVALRRSEEEYRNLFELANDSIFIVDASTNRILNANRHAARRLGYTRRELLQLSFNELELQQDTSVDKDSIAKELQRFGSVVYDCTLCRKDGTRLPVQVSSRLIEYEDRLALQSFVRDIRP